MMLAQGTLDFRSIKFKGKVWQTRESRVPPLFPEADASNAFNLARYHQTSSTGVPRDGLAQTDDILAKIVRFFYARLPRRRFERAERKEQTLETGTIDGKGKDGGDKEFHFLGNFTEKRRFHSLRELQRSAEISCRHE